VAKKQKGGTPATVLLQRLGLAFTPHEYAHDPARPRTGWKRQEVLGVEPGRVFKTLLATVDEKLTVAVIPVSSTLDLKALAAARGAKRAAMADPAEAERSTGYVVGGISPIGQRRALPTVVDDSAWSYDTVYVSGGRRGFDLELSPDAIMAATSAVAATIARQ
jgi:Cys-tRNA(Pro)/Cys-tRNA(Cys) deacylase